MILSGPMIRREVAQGNIEIDPFDPEQINPASYDLTLGDEVLCYEFGMIHDAKEEPTKFRHARIGPEGFVVHPGKGYLMATAERVHTDKYVGCLDGKSSMGRLFLLCHFTAGYVDPSFSGQLTLEVATHEASIRLYAGMRIAQIRFHAMLGEPMKYEGNYHGDAAKGPVPSALWKQFRKAGST